MKLRRFAPPLPGRTIGLGWHYSSPRNVDFAALVQVVTETLGSDRKEKAAHAAN